MEKSTNKLNTVQPGLTSKFLILKRNELLDTVKLYAKSESKAQAANNYIKDIFNQLRLLDSIYREYLQRDSEGFIFPSIFSEDFTDKLFSFKTTETYDKKEIDFINITEFLNGWDNFPIYINISQAVMAILYNVGVPFKQVEINDLDSISNLNYINVYTYLNDLKKLVKSGQENPIKTIEKIQLIKRGN